MNMCVLIGYIDLTNMTILRIVSAQRMPETACVHLNLMNGFPE